MRWAEREPHDVYVNLRYSSPVDYDLGSTYGAALDYSASDAQLCIPIKLYSASVVSQFQFVLRFDSGAARVLDGVVWHVDGGSAWTAFGGSVAYSPDSGQVDFATVASVSSAGRSGLLDIGTLCLDVIGTGSLQLQVQMKVHIDASGTRDCSSGGHLYRMGSRCYSRRPTWSSMWPALAQAARVGSSSGLERGMPLPSPHGRGLGPGGAHEHRLERCAADDGRLPVPDERQQVLTDKQAGTQSFHRRPGRQLARDQLQPEPRLLRGLHDPVRLAE